MTLSRLLIKATVAAAFLVAASAAAHDTEAERKTDAHAHRKAPWTRSPLVATVRAATQRYADINVAMAEGWVPATPCVSGPNEGAMGVHYVLPERIGDGALQVDQPEALIYEPRPGGKMQLVGVEFIVLAQQWNTENPDAQPALDGHLLNLVGEPNRYRLPAFYELHVWAWERNPNGAFSDWNTSVSCEAQPSTQ